jgi:hypothetical protein
MKTVWWAFLGIGLAGSAGAIIIGLRAGHSRAKIIDDALQAGFVSVLALIFILPSGVAQATALGTAAVIVARGIWMVLGSRPR